MTASAPIRLLFANIPSMTAGLLQSALDDENVAVVLGNARSTDELGALLLSGTPRVVLVGAHPGNEQPSGLPFVEQISALAPQVRQIVLGDNLGLNDQVTLLRAGARGLLCESETNIAVLSKCICCVASGEIWASHKQLEHLLQSLSYPRSLRVTNALGETILSPREEQVLNLLAEGLSNRDLAAALKLSEHTVKNHLFRIFDKLGVSSRMEAVLYAITWRHQQPAQLPRIAPPARALSSFPRTAQY